MEQSQAKKLLCFWTLFLTVNSIGDWHDRGSVCPGEVLGGLGGEELKQKGAEQSALETPTPPNCGPQKTFFFFIPFVCLAKVAQTQNLLSSNTLPLKSLLRKYPIKNFRFFVLLHLL
jgi:hypothetical protein